MNKENTISVYINTIPSSDGLFFGNTSTTFKNVVQDYCKDFQKIEKILDILFIKGKPYYEKFGRVKLYLGNVSALSKEYILRLYSLLEKYGKLNLDIKKALNRKFIIVTSDEIFSKVTKEELNQYFVITKIIYNKDTYKKPVISIVNSDDLFRKGIYSDVLGKSFVSYDFILSDESDEFFFDKFKAGDFINVPTLPLINHNLFSKEQFTLIKSKFYPGIIKYDDNFKQDDCSKYSYYFGIDLVNNTIFKCHHAYDYSFTIELNEENLNKMLDFKECLIPEYSNKEICKNCKLYNIGYEKLSYNFKRKK